MTDKPLDLDAIKKRVEKASPGPWKFKTMKTDSEGYTSVSECDEMSGTGLQHVNDNAENYGNDWHFICNSREDIPALLSECETLRETVIEMADILEILGKMECGSLCQMLRGLNETTVRHRGMCIEISAALSLPAVQALKEPR